MHLFSSGQGNDDSLKTLITEDEPFKKHTSMISLEKLSYFRVRSVLCHPTPHHTINYRPKSVLQTKVSVIFYKVYFLLVLFHKSLTREKFRKKTIIGKPTSAGGTVFSRGPTIDQYSIGHTIQG